MRFHAVLGLVISIPAAIFPTTSAVRSINHRFQSFSIMDSRDVLGSNCASNEKGSVEGISVRKPMKIPELTGCDEMAIEISVSSLRVL